MMASKTNCKRRRRLPEWYIPASSFELLAELSSLPVLITRRGLCCSERRTLTYFSGEVRPNTYWLTVAVKHVQDTHDMTIGSLTCPASHAEGLMFCWYYFLSFFWRFPWRPELSQNVLDRCTWLTIVWALCISAKCWPQSAALSCIGNYVLPAAATTLHCIKNKN